MLVAIVVRVEYDLDAFRCGVVDDLIHVAQLGSVERAIFPVLQSIHQER